MEYRICLDPFVSVLCEDGETWLTMNEIQYRSLCWTINFYRRGEHATALTDRAKEKLREHFGVKKCDQ